jgi:hypothetical protein
MEIENAGVEAGLAAERCVKLLRNARRTQCIAGYQTSATVRRVAFGARRVDHCRNKAWLAIGP